MIIIDIIYKSKKIEILCNSLKEAKKQLGDKTGKRLLQRNCELKAFENLSKIPSSLPYKREKLTNKNNVWSIRIDQEWRLIIKPTEPNDNLALITSIIIMEVSKHYE
mgnify:CR=1 FL=1